MLVQASVQEETENDQKKRIKKKETNTQRRNTSDSYKDVRKLNGEDYTPYHGNNHNNDNYMKYLLFRSCPLQLSTTMDPFLQTKQTKQNKTEHTIYLKKNPAKISYVPARPEPRAILVGNTQ